MDISLYIWWESRTRRGEYMRKKGWEESIRASGQLAPRLLLSLPLSLFTSILLSSNGVTNNPFEIPRILPITSSCQHYTMCLYTRTRIQIYIYTYRYGSHTRVYRCKDAGAAKALSTYQQHQQGAFFLACTRSRNPHKRNLTKPRFLIRRDHVYNISAFRGYVKLIELIV